ncbi:HEAT repeat domain-containing protein [Luteolibacter marinus]|uniref:HEAT repeat domain-containing protein n=1 Tax=Luteolibacter marinus TaxID=2776705 RepID=UPI001866C6EF
MRRLLPRLVRWPKTALGRVAFGFGLLFGIVVAGIGLIAGSVWMEHKYPSDEEGMAILPRTQRWITRPIVAALGREIQSHYRRTSEARYLETGLSLAETIGRFLDVDEDLVTRRELAFRLAREGTPEALAALEAVLQSAATADQVFILRLIGRAGNPATIPLLVQMARDPAKKAACGAIEALGMIGGDEATARVATILSGDAWPRSSRIQAAITLGSMGTTASRLALGDAFGAMPSPELAAEILSGLGRYDFEQVAPTFRSFLADEGADGALRVVAVEALANSSPDAVPYLIELARADGDAEVRESAAWAISTQPGIGAFGDPLVDMTAVEPEEDVRRRLYEAMLHLPGLPPGRILPLVLEETDTAARVAGLNALGRAAREHPGSAETARFDLELVPELRRIATRPNSLNLQMRAVFALRRAGTPAAGEALAAIANEAPPPVAAAARNGLAAISP